MSISTHGNLMVASELAGDPVTGLYSDYEFFTVVSAPGSSAAMIDLEILKAGNVVASSRTKWAALNQQIGKIRSTGGDLDGAEGPDSSKNFLDLMITPDSDLSIRITVSGNIKEEIVIKLAANQLFKAQGPGQVVYESRLTTSDF